MTIAIDARWIFEKLSGIGVYTQELIRHLIEIDKENKYILLFDQESVLKRVKQNLAWEAKPHVITKLVSFGIFSIKNQLKLPGLLKEWEVDVYHSPNYMIPFLAFPRGDLGRIKCVTTIHDLIPLRFPGYTPKSKKTKFFPLYKQVMQEGILRANRIITVSKFSKDDIVEFFQLNGPAKKVRVVHNGVSPIYRTGTKVSREEKIILYVGRMDPYKNVVSIIDAFSQVLEAKRFPVRLKIIGALDPRYPEATKRAGVLHLSQHIDWLKYVDQEALVNAYQQADVFVMPSKYEGFGLPVLEAMACGTPVVCSDRASLPEVAGEAALYCNPDDPSSIANKILSVFDDGVLYEKLRIAGIEQAKEFTWAKTAKETLEVYRSLDSRR